MKTKPPIDLTQFDGITPGEWTYDDVWNLINGQHGQEICAIHSAVDLTEKRCKQNTAAINARAIAAVPDLIAEIKRLREALAILIIADEVSGPGFSVLREKARALLPATP